MFSLYLKVMTSLGIGVLWVLWFDWFWFFVLGLFFGVFFPVFLLGVFFCLFLLRLRHVKFVGIS